MSVRERLNRLDERTGADRVGHGLRLYGLYVVHPFCLVIGVVFGVMALVRGKYSVALGLLAFATAAGALIYLGVRAERSHRRFQQAKAEDTDPPVFDVR